MSWELFQHKKWRKPLQRFTIAYLVPLHAAGLPCVVICLSLSLGRKEVRAILMHTELPWLQVEVHMWESCRIGLVKCSFGKNRTCLSFWFHEEIKKKSCLLTYILTFIFTYVDWGLCLLLALLIAVWVFWSQALVTERSWKSSKLLSSGFSSLKWGCHIFSVTHPGMVQSPFEWGNQISRGKTSGELSNKSCEIRRMLLGVRIVVFFSPLMQMSSCGNTSILGIQTQIIQFLRVWKKALFCSC